MKKRLTMTVVACAFLAVAMGVNTKTKIRSFSPVGNGLIENVDCDGMAMISYSDHDGMTDVQVVLHDFLPNTIYGIKLTSDGGGFSDPIAVQTNPAGNGNYHTSLPQNRTGHPMVTVYIWDGNFDPDSIDIVTDDEKRAVGTAL